MFDLQSLYQEVIVDHNRSPRNFGPLEHPDRVLEGYNPLCGDRLKLYLKLSGDLISDISFDGAGCAISVASASLMTEAMKGKTTDEAETMFDEFHDLVTGADGPVNHEKLGKLSALAGVREYPTRIKCATLCWHALRSALTTERTTVSTE